MHDPEDATLPDDEQLLRNHVSEEFLRRIPEKARRDVAEEIRRRIAVAQASKAITEWLEEDEDPDDDGEDDAVAAAPDVLANRVGGGAMYEPFLEKYWNGLSR